MPSDIGFVTRARLQLAYFSGYALIMQRRAGGAGIVLRFQRVRPRRGDRFQPLKSAEITPQFLDRARVRLETMVRGADILVLSTHETAIVRTWCSRVLWLDEGRIRADGPPDEVLAQYLGHKLEPLTEAVATEHL